MKSNKKIIRNAFRLIILIFAFVAISQQANAFRYNRNNTKKVINKTAFVIDEAYEISNYYDYWQRDMLSKAVYYNEYAYKLMRYRNYNSSIYYSLRAREYALRVIDECDSYWDYYYYSNYGWSRTYGRNPYYNSNRDPNNHYYGNYNNYYNRNYNPNNDYNNNNSNNSPYYQNDEKLRERQQGSQFNSNNNNNGSGLPTGQLSSVSGRENLKNINYDNYFDPQERMILEQVPNDENLESQFKRENPNINFDDKELKNNREIISRNKVYSEEYSKKLNNTTREEIKFVEPKSVEKGEIIKRRNAEPNLNERIKLENTRIESNRNSETLRNTRPVKDVYRPVYNPSNIKTNRNDIKTNSSIERNTDTRNKEINNNASSRIKLDNTTKIKSNSRTENKQIENKQIEKKQIENKSREERSNTKRNTTTKKRTIAN